MNENKIDFLGRIQQSHGVLNGDFTSDFGNRSCQNFDTRQVWNMGACNQQPLAMLCGVGEQPPYTTSPAKSSSSTMISRFESPVSAFYATEVFMGFPQYDSQVGNNNNNDPSLISQYSSKKNELDFPLYQPPKENLLLDSPPNQSSPNFEFSNSLQLQTMKSQLSSDQCCGSPETRTTTLPQCLFLPSPKKSNKIPCGNFPSRNFIPVDAATVSMCPSIHKVACGSYNLPVARMSFSSQQEKMCPTLSSGSVSTTSGNPASNGSVASSKTRIRWTQDLHEKFVECVNRLGGAEKATPKAILRLMESDGLTIFHVKSHLQKYRIAKYMPESTQGKSDKRTQVENVPLDVKTGLQIREALQLQLDVQRRLHDQLEIQRKLQLRIEEQGKQLQVMFDQQQKTSNNLLNTQNLGNITTKNDKPPSANDFEVSTSQGSENSFFHSKIS